MQAIQKRATGTEGTDADVDTFVREHLVHVKGAISREICDEWVDEFFLRTGIDEGVPSTFPRDKLFAGTTRSVPLQELSPYGWDLTCALCGGGERIVGENHCLSNNFNLNFNRGADEPWTGPGPDSRGWHKDGWFFRHFLDSPEQALLVLVIWRDIGPRSGGTFYVRDSVKPVCKKLLQHPEGLHHTGPFGSLVKDCQDFREVQAEAGDIIFMHPFMIHAGSQNHSGRIRFMNNHLVTFAEPMQFNRPDGGYSPVEQIILDCLGVKSLDFKITRERLRTPDNSRLPDEEEAA